MTTRQLAFTLCISLSLGLLTSCGGGSDKLNDDTAADTSTSAPYPTLKIDVTPAAIARGKLVYTQTCVPCHGADGKGDGPAAAALNPKPQDHTNGAYMDKLTDGHIYAVIRQGGQQFGKPGMPPNPQLTEDQTKDVIAYVRSLSNTFKAQ